MNIFYLHTETRLCAEWHVDKHTVKMILEYSQLLSTAHRLLDGTMSIGKSKTGRNVKRWILSDDRDSIIYNATHINHPSAIWTRESIHNYTWLHNLLNDLCIEYTHRYGKIHKVESSGLLTKLKTPPKNISTVKTFTEPPPAMPDQYKVSNDSAASYRNYYIGAKNRFAKWKNRSIPPWYDTSKLAS